MLFIRHYFLCRILRMILLTCDQQRYLGSDYPVFATTGNSIQSDCFNYIKLYLRSSVFVFSLSRQFHYFSFSVGHHTVISSTISTVLYITVKQGLTALYQVLLLIKDSFKMVKKSIQHVMSLSITGFFQCFLLTYYHQERCYSVGISAFRFFLNYFKDIWQTHF